MGQIAVLADKRVVINAPIGGRALRPPVGREYFHGPRARAARDAVLWPQWPEGGAWKPRPFVLIGAFALVGIFGLFFRRCGRRPVKSERRWTPAASSSTRR